MTKTKPTNQDCCFCGPQVGTHIRKLKFPYALWKCSKCELVQIYPKPTKQELSEIYSKEYFNSQDSGYSDYFFQEASLIKTYSELLFTHKIDVKGKSVLDVGSGPGFFLSLMKEKGASSFYAIEPAPEAQKFLQNNGVALIGNNIEDYEIKKEFDLIACMQTLEHIYHPQVLLNKLYNSLKKDGKLIIAVPNYNSWLRMCLGIKWPSYKVPEHLTYFNKKTFTFALKQSGITNFEIKTMDYYFPLRIIRDNGIRLIPTQWNSKLVKIRSTSLVAIIKKEI
jgi:2-polyprenyl-3-methyl-5-hydroxy-6-metoxy-1,4-benzoquinol methylase